jgi:hypothetical protein
MADTEEFTVPTGDKYIIQGVSILDLWLDGELIDPLSAEVALLVVARDAELDQITTIEQEQLKGFTVDRQLLAIRQVVRAMTVDPVVTADREDAKQLRAEGRNVKPWQYLDNADRWALFYKAMGDAAAMRHVFREYERRTHALAALQHGHNNGAASVGPAGDPANAAVGAADGG